jgi:hypothetical protein
MFQRYANAPVDICSDRLPEAMAEVPHSDREFTQARS